MTSVGAACPNCGAAVEPGARFCASCGTPLAPIGIEERKLATIVFADVIGSTDLGEQLDPERLRAVLQEYFGEMARVVAVWGGTVEKYIGDAVVAVFGVPVAREDDAVRALHAATDMLAALDKLNGGLEERHGVRLGIRIGVNTGEVLAPAGGRSGGQMLVSGDPVNVAARLEQAADPRSVLVGERTWSAARDVFSFGEPTSLTVKGKREPVVARRLGQASAGEQRGVRFQAPMVGRDRELQTVLGLLEEAVENQSPYVAVISGPAGIGKSRLLREFVAAATVAYPDLAILRGRCLAAGHGITFWALGEILRAAFHISLDEPGESAAEKLTRSLDELLGPLNLSPTERAETVFALATTANVSLAGNPLDRLEPERVGDAMARGWPRFLAALTLRSPVTLVIEDLHWADERMVAMLELLGARSVGRLLLLATARPEFLDRQRDFAASEDLTVVSLRPLTDAQSDRLVGELLGDSDAPATLIDEVRQKADGNPFFLEEILQRLIDEGAIVRDGGRWRATEHAARVRLPDTIHALLAARIDALPTPEKAVIQQAAVVGRTFWPGSIGALIENTPDVLRSLERRGLVSARPSSTIEGETEYIFRHVLIRDVAYASVPKSRRARAHAETATWIERLAGDRAEQFDELLAYHYTAAAVGEDADLAWADAPDERERLRRAAFEMSLRAAAGARHRFAVDMATSLDERARNLAVDDTELARAFEALGDDHEVRFHMDEAIAMYFDAVDAARRAHGSNADIGMLAAKVAAASTRWGAFRMDPPVDRIRALLSDGLARDSEPALRARLLIGFGGLASFAPRGSARAPISEENRAFLAASIEAAEEGLGIARELDDTSLQWRAYDILGMLHLHAGAFERFQEAVESEAALIDLLPSAREKVDALTTVALARGAAGRYRQSLAAAEQGYELAVGLSGHERMHASFVLMMAAEALGEWDRVLEVLAWHVEAAAAEPDITCPNVRGGPPLGARVLINRGLADQAALVVAVDERASERNTLYDRSLVARYASLIGRADIANAIVDKLAASPDRVRYPEGFVDFFETLRRLGRDEDVARLLPAARKLMPAAMLIGPTADRADAELALKAGRREDSQRLLKAALRGFDELSVPFEAAQTREMLADVSELGEAHILLRAALETYEQLGATPSVERVRAALAGTTPTAAI